jgi:hypothetical protein
MGAWEDGFAAGYRHALRTSSPAVAAVSGTVKRTPKSKKSRKPSAYNRFMSSELKKLRKKHPRTAQATLFKRAAKSWKRKKGKR